MLSPIVLFVYNRPEHTQQTLDALAGNVYANESHLFIYSDAPKEQHAIKSVSKVREIIKKSVGFKSITIVEQESNQGLAGSIITGVTNVINQYGKIIVLEDDIVTSPYFLQFMNKALDYFIDEKKVWHISGWNYQIDTEGLEDAFLWRVMNCWGWATWKDRWQYFEKDADKLIANFTKTDIYHFNLNGTENFWGQVLSNKRNTVNTWAIFWYATIFKKDGLCLNPVKSFVRNIGFDGSGTHSDNDTTYSDNILCEVDINFDSLIIKENDIVVKKIMSFYTKENRRLKNIYRRFLGRIFRFVKWIIRELDSNIFLSV